MRLGSGHGFVSGDSLWLRVYISASGVFLDFRESIAKAGMRDSFGIMQLLGMLRELRKYSEVRLKGLEAQR